MAMANKTVLGFSYFVRGDNDQTNEYTKHGQQKKMRARTPKDNFCLVKTWQWKKMSEDTCGDMATSIEYLRSHTWKRTKKIKNRRTK